MVKDLIILEVARKDWTRFLGKKGEEGMELLQVEEIFLGGGKGREV